MSLTEQVLAQARFMAPELIEDNVALLETLCKAAVSSLSARLREDLDPEDCLADFVTAAGMYALAAMSEIGDWSKVEQLTAGDMTVRRDNTNAAAAYLRSQAELLMTPYLRPGFAFVGV